MQFEGMLSSTISSCTNQTKHCSIATFYLPWQWLHVKKVDWTFYRLFLIYFLFNNVQMSAIQAYTHPADFSSFSSKLNAETRKGSQELV